MGPGGFPMTAGVSVLPKLYDTVPKAINLLESGETTAAKKKIVTDFFKQREPLRRCNKNWRVHYKRFYTEKNFFRSKKSYMSRFNPTLTGAAKDIGTTRNFTLKGIAERINLQETGKNFSNGFDPYAQVAKIPEPEGRSSVQRNDHFNEKRLINLGFLKKIKMNF